MAGVRPATCCSDIDQDEGDELWPQPPAMQLPPLLPGEPPPFHRLHLRQQQRRPYPLPSPFSPTLAWALFTTWAHNPNRQRDMPGHVLQLLEFYMWLVIFGKDSPAKFLTAVQQLLRRTLPPATTAPTWVRDAVYRHDFV